MRTALGAALAVLLAAALVSCSSDKVTAPTTSQLVGLWDATQVQYVNQANPDEVVEIISTGGTGTLRLRADGTFELVVVPFGFDANVLGGEWQLTGNGTRMILTPSDTTRNASTFAVSLSGGRLSLTGGEMESAWDFTGDGILDPAIVNLVFVRAH